MFKIPKPYIIISSTILLITVVFLVLSLQMKASFSPRIEYQGKLMTSANAVVADNIYDLEFKLCNSLSGTCTSGDGQVWNEIRSTSNLWTESTISTITTNDSTSCGGTGFTKIAYSTDSNESSLAIDQRIYNSTKKTSYIIKSLDTTSNYICIQNPVVPWEATDTITNRTLVKGGIFSVMLGDINPISNVNFNNDLYLEISVYNTNTTSWEKLSPRKKLSTTSSSMSLNGYTWETPPAIGSITPNTATFTLTTVTGDTPELRIVNSEISYSSIARIGTDNVLIIKNKVSYESNLVDSQIIKSQDSSDPNTKSQLDLGDIGGGTNFIGKNIHFTTDQGEKLTLLSNGNIGIGTTTPVSLLTIYASNPELRMINVDNGSYLKISRGGSNGLSFYNKPNNATDDSDNTKLLLHGDGPNGSTTFLDYSPSPKNLYVYNEPYLSTTQSKFGGSSMYFDGSNDYISSPSNTDFEFGTNDWTMDFWFRANSSVNAWKGIGGGDWDIVSGNGSNYSMPVFAYNNVHPTSGKIFTVYLSSTTGGNPKSISATLDCYNKWNHIALVRFGATVTLYLNGIASGNVNIGDSANLIKSGFMLGRYLNNGSMIYSDGYIDEFRIVNGKAMWTSNFNTALPSVPYSVPGMILSSSDSTNVNELGELRVGDVNSGLSYNTKDLFKFNINESEKLIIGENILGLNSSEPKSILDIAGTQIASGGSAIAANIHPILTPINNSDIMTALRIDPTFTSGDNKYGLVVTNGSVGIGTTTPTSLLTLSSTSPEIKIINSDDGNYSSIIRGGNNKLLFYNKSNVSDDSDKIKLLLHGDGLNSSLLFFDDSPSSKKITPYNEPYLSTTQSKFGGSSMYFDGSNDYISSPSNTDFEFGTN
ncbi:MAG: LamG domain-containing protein, partial [Patescibacteria group bacterium]